MAGEGSCQLAGFLHPVSVQGPVPLQEREEIVRIKERETLQEMYRSLEQLPGNIRRDFTIRKTEEERNAMADGAERARVLVYTWLREANMIPPGGR